MHRKYRTSLLEENLRHLTDELIEISNVYFNLTNKLKLQLHWSIINYSRSLLSGYTGCPFSDSGLVALGTGGRGFFGLSVSSMGFSCSLDLLSTSDFASSSSGGVSALPRGSCDKFMRSSSSCSTSFCFSFCLIGGGGGGRLTLGI